jgi:REP element-mobilizing transposase RayT
MLKQKGENIMPHTYGSIYIHCVFSTKRRERLLNEPICERLWEYMGGIARGHGFKTIIAGGTDDHAHALVSLPTSLSISRTVQFLKGSSSKWIHETFSGSGNFAWQDGYGAFSIGTTQIKRTMDYIRNQEQHHVRERFEDEFIGLLRHHDIDFDERTIWV